MTDIEERNWDAVLRAHRNLIGTINEAYKATIASAAGALRLLSTINAGGAIALLGFIGATTGKHIFANGEPFITPLTLFGLGLISSAVATCGMYFAQYAFGMWPTKVKVDHMHPYVHETVASNRWRKGGMWLQGATIFVAAISFAFFCVGLYFCRDLVLSAKF